MATGCSRDSKVSSTAPAHPAPSRASDAAPIDPLRLGLDGVGPLRSGMPIDREELVGLLPGYTVVVTEDSFEGQSFEVWEIRSGDATVVRLVPSDGVIGALTVLSSAIASDTGVAVGTGYAEVRDRIGPLTCELTYHDDMFPVQPTCTASRAPGWNIVFAPVDAEGLGEGQPVPPDRQQKLLAGAVVEAIDFR